MWGGFNLLFLFFKLKKSLEGSNKNLVRGEGQKNMFFFGGEVGKFIYLFFLVTIQKKIAGGNYFFFSLVQNIIIIIFFFGQIFFFFLGAVKNFFLRGGSHFFFNKKKNLGKKKRTLQLSYWIGKVDWCSENFDNPTLGVLITHWQIILLTYPV